MWTEPGQHPGRVIEQAMSRCNMGNHAWLRPCTPQGISSLDPFCGRFWLTARTMPRCSLENTGNTQKALYKIRLSYCKLKVALPPHGLGGVPPPTGCCASGENKKKPTGKFTFRVGLFPYFHCARGAYFVRAFRSYPLANISSLFTILPSFPLPGGNAFVLPYNRFACWVQGGTPCRRGSGAAAAVPQPIRKKALCMKKLTSACNNQSAHTQFARLQSA